MMTLMEPASQDGSTPLHHASKKGHDTVAQALIAAGADVHAADTASVWMLLSRLVMMMMMMMTMMMTMIWRQSPASQGGSTPLHRAIEEGNEKVAEALIAAGADANMKDKVSLV